MTELKGKGICAGIAEGTVFFVNKASCDPQKRMVSDTYAEISKFHNAVDEAIKPAFFIKRNNRKISR